MIFGKLDRKLTLYKQGFTKNLYGELESTSTTNVTIYGSFDFKGVSLGYESDALVSETRIECLIRYRKLIDCSPQYYIKNGNNSYAIRGIREVGRKDKMILDLELKDLENIFTS